MTDQEEWTVGFSTAAWAAAGTLTVDRTVSSLWLFVNANGEEFQIAVDPADVPAIVARVAALTSPGPAVTDDDLTRIGKRLEVLFAATQTGQTEAFHAFQEAAALLVPVFAELREYRRVAGVGEP